MRLVLSVLNNNNNIRKQFNKNIQFWFNYFGITKYFKSSHKVYIFIKINLILLYQTYLMDEFE